MSINLAGSHGMTNINGRVIMLLDNSFRPDLRVLREAEALIQLGLSVTIVAWDRDIEFELPKHEVINSVEVVRICVKTKRHLGVMQIIPYIKFAAQAFQYIKQQQVSVIHCHDLPDLPIGVALKLYKRIPLIYDAHEIYWIMDALRYPKWISYFQKVGELFLLKWADALITVGEKRVQYYQPHFSKNIYLVGNYYDPKQRDYTKGQDFRNKLSIPKDAFVVAYAGTLSVVRGIDTIIECADQFQAEGANVHFVIAGVGVLEPLVREAAERNKLIHFLGWVNDLSEIYSGSDALVYLMQMSHPYTQYNSPNTLYLSIAWQVPLIAVGAGEIENVISTEESGILLKEIDLQHLHSAILQISERGDLYHEIVANLTSLQEKYSWKAARNNLFAAYKSLNTSQVGQMKKVKPIN
jgi:glycosyltransferase involved in cell wall biosynthesis